MGLSLADIERWDSSSIAAVASAADGQGRVTRMIADQLGAVVDGIRWAGHAADAARAAMWQTRQGLYRHADDYQAVAKAASGAAPQVADIKHDLQLIKDEAAAWDITIDSATGALTWPVYASQSSALQALVAEAADDIAVRIVELMQRAEKVDTELADAINRSDAPALGFGPDADMSVSPGFDDVRRRANQTEAFRTVFGRDPVSAADWDTAAALDPHSYEPKNRDVPPNIVVGRIEPVPGQGVVRTNLFIPGRTAWTPFGDNLGDARPFEPSAGPELSRVSFYVDYENGIVVGRQNPSVMNGQAKTGTPDIRVSQNPNGSVLINYVAADPYSPGGEDIAKASPWNVHGRLVIKPTDAGPIAGGIISDFPAVEIYNDRNGATKLVDRIFPQNISPMGPLIALPFSQQIGPGLMGEFPDDLNRSVQPSPSRVPMPPPVVAPYPSVELGPVDQHVTVPVGK